MYKVFLDSFIASRGDPQAELRSPDVVDGTGCESCRKPVLICLWVRTCLQLLNPNMGHTRFTLFRQLCKRLLVIRKEEGKQRMDVPQTIREPHLHILTWEGWNRSTTTAEVSISLISGLGEEGWAQVLLWEPAIADSLWKVLGNLSISLSQAEASVFH